MRTQEIAHVEIANTRYERFIGVLLIGRLSINC